MVSVRGLRISDLMKRLTDQVEELIIAVAPTVEGEATPFTYALVHPWA